LETILQLLLTLVIETGCGPVILKSLPPVSMELHCIGFLKTNFKETGEHFFTCTLSIGVGCNGAIVNESCWPGDMGLLQISSNVLPSEPFCAVRI
jgi:hypothetical protein